MSLAIQLWYMAMAYETVNIGGHYNNYNFIFRFVGFNYSACLILQSWEKLRRYFLSETWKFQVCYGFNSGGCQRDASDQIC